MSVFFFASLTLWTGVGLCNKLVRNPHKAPIMQDDTLQMQKWKSASLVKAYAQLLCNMEAKLFLDIVNWASQSMSEVVSYHAQATQTRVPNQPSTWVVQSSTLLLWYARALALPCFVCSTVGENAAVRWTRVHNQLATACWNSRATQWLKMQHTAKRIWF